MSWDHSFQSRFDEATQKLLTPTFVAAILIAGLHSIVHSTTTPSVPALLSDVTQMVIASIGLLYHRIKLIRSDITSLVFIMILSLVAVNVVIHRLLGAESTEYSLGVLMVCAAFTLVKPAHFLVFGVSLWGATFVIHIAQGGVDHDSLFLLFIVTLACGIAYFTRRARQIELETARDELERALERTKQALGDSEALRRDAATLDLQLRTIAENMSDVVYIYDTDGIIEYVSPSVKGLLGFEPEERVGLSYRESSMTEDSLTDVAPLFREALEGTLDEARVEIQHRRKDGELVWTETRGCTIRNNEGAVEGICVVIRDITERRAAESNLRESEARYRHLTESSIDPILSFDQDGLITYASPAAEGAWGQAVEKLIGAPHDLGQTPPSRERSRIALGRLRSGESQQEQLEVEHALPTGESVWSEIRAWPLFSDDTFAGFQFIARDITERKSTSATLERQQRRLAARAQELTYLNEQLDQFAATVTHDLQAPVRRLLNRIQRNHSSVLDVDERAEITDELQRIGALMDRLLNAATDREPLQKEDVDLGQLVRRVVSHRSLETGRDCVLRAPEPRKALVWGDPLLIELLIENLVGNAYKFTPTDRSLELSVSVEQDDDTFVVTMTDNGDGFPVADPSILFDFSRQGASRKPGHGVGLSSVQNIVRRHGGEITLANPANGGARITFTLQGEQTAITDYRG